MARLASQLEARTASERELRRRLSEAHAQVAARDEQLQRLEGELERERVESSRLLREAQHAHVLLDEMRRTRVWRAGRLWWWLHDSLLRRDA